MSGLSVRCIRDLELGRVRMPRRQTCAMLADALRLTGTDRESFLALAIPPSEPATLAVPPSQPVTLAVPPSQPTPFAAPPSRSAALPVSSSRPTAIPVSSSRPTNQSTSRPAGRLRGRPIVVPGELPPAINDLTGRDDELGVVAAHAMSAATGHSTGPVVVVLHGLAGVGKTSLAVVAGRRVWPGFPDGQLFVDLRGDTGEPLNPREGLARLLRSLGVPEEGVPPATADRIALYRSLTHDRRLVVVLDNAAGEGHVRPLLPTGAGCLVLVTARGPLPGLDAAERLAMDVLAPPDAGRLLGIIVGPRAAAEAEAVAELSILCGHLPLALRIVGNRLAARPSWSVARMAGELRHENTRLDGLTAGDRGVRTAFAASYAQLTPSAAEAFRRCARIGRAEFSADTATVAALEELVDAGLLLAAGDRYRFHELVRLFAREQRAG